MDKHFIFSFIIPHKNIPELLSRCVNSIPERDDVQVIIVDDNSDPDKKPRVFHSNTEVVLLDAEQSKGAGRARNIGIEHAKGKWVLFADSDDYYCEGFLGILENELNDNLDILYFNILSEDDDPENRANIWIRKYEKYFHSEKRDIIKYAFNEPWDKVVSHQLVLDSGVRFEERPSGNDVMFSMNIGAAAKNVKFINEHLYYLTTQPNSIVTSKRSFEHVYNKLDLSIKHDTFNKEHGLEELRHPMISFAKLRFLINSYGIKNTVKYLKKLNGYTNVIAELFKSIKYKR